MEVCNVVYLGQLCYKGRKELGSKKKDFLEWIKSKTKLKRDWKPEKNMKGLGLTLQSRLT